MTLTITDGYKRLKLSATETCVLAALIQQKKAGVESSSLRKIAEEMPVVICHMSIKMAIQKLEEKGILKNGRLSQNVTEVYQNVTEVSQSVTDLSQNVTNSSRARAT